MIQFTTKEKYMAPFRAALDSAGDERAVLVSYLNKQSQKLTHLTEGISQETFWQVFPEILGVDAKLMLLTELIPFEDFSNEEIIRIIENDYRSYFKELCGYDLKVRDKPSLIFNIS